LTAARCAAAFFSASQRLWELLHLQRTVFNAVTKQFLKFPGHQRAFDLHGQRIGLQAMKEVPAFIDLLQLVQVDKAHQTAPRVVARLVTGIVQVLSVHDKATVRVLLASLASQLVQRACGFVVGKVTAIDADADAAAVLVYKVRDQQHRMVQYVQGVPLAGLQAVLNCQRLPPGAQAGTGPVKQSWCLRQHRQGTASQE
jgi:hypothetical protein